MRLKHGKKAFRKPDRIMDFVAENWEYKAEFFRTLRFFWDQCMWGLEVEVEHTSWAASRPHEAINMRTLVNRFAKYTREFMKCRPSWPAWIKETGGGQLRPSGF